MTKSKNMVETNIPADLNEKPEAMQGVGMRISLPAADGQPFASVIVVGGNLAALKAVMEKMHPGAVVDAMRCRKAVVVCAEHLQAQVEGGARG